MCPTQYLIGIVKDNIFTVYGITNKVSQGDLPGMQERYNN